MSARLIDMLLRLSPRERRLLGLACGLVLPLAVVFGLLLPLHDSHARARAARDDARALQLWVAESAREKTRLARHAAPPVGPPIGSAGIEQSLIAANLRSAVSTLGAQADGSVDLRFEAVNFRRLADWLSATHPGWGYDIRSYVFEPGPRPGTAALQLILVPPDR